MTVDGMLQPWIHRLVEGANEAFLFFSPGPHPRLHVDLYRRGEAIAGMAVEPTAVDELAGFLMGGLR